MVFLGLAIMAAAVAIAFWQSRKVSKQSEDQLPSFWFRSIAIMAFGAIGYVLFTWDSVPRVSGSLSISVVSTIVSYMVGFVPSFLLTYATFVTVIIWHRTTTKKRH